MSTGPEAVADLDKPYCHDEKYKFSDDKKPPKKRHSLRLEQRPDLQQKKHKATLKKRSYKKRSSEDEETSNEIAEIESDEDVNDSQKI
jgi:hypothetical protein